MTARHWLRALVGAARPRRRTRPAPLRLEALEERTVPNTYNVTQAADNGTGGTAHSLSWAIDNANNHSGSLINIQVSVSPTALEPALTAATTVDGNGWTLNGRLLRPAMVMVAKAPPAEIGSAFGGPAGAAKLNTTA